MGGEAKNPISSERDGYEEVAADEQRLLSRGWSNSSEV
jgi:hypothetical protein